MKRPFRISLDLDDLLWNFNGAFALHHNELFGTTITLNDIVGHELQHVYGCTLEEMVSRIDDFFFSPNHIMTPALAGAIEMVHDLANDAELHGNTARPQGCEQQTWELLNQLFGADAFHAVHFTNQFGGNEKGLPVITKVDICERYRLDLHADDHPGHVAGVVQSGRHGVLLNTPWNACCEDRTLTRMNNIPAVHRIIRCRMELAAA